MNTPLTWPLNVPVLTDGTVTLRAHTPADIDDMLEMANDPDTGRWTTVPQPHTREMSEEFAFSVIPQAWNENKARMWAIEAVADDGRPRYVGNVDIRGQHNPDVGFAVHPWARGRGFMSRAMRLAAEWVFENDGADIIHWGTHVGNADSLRVAHRTGFMLNAVVPGMVHEKGRTIDGWTATLRPGDVMLPRTRWAESTELVGDRVALRAFTDADIPRIVEACSDPVSTKWLNGLPSPYTDDVARGYIADCVWRAALGDKATWAIADRDTGHLVGNIAVMNMTGLNPNRGEIGYWMHPDSRGRGLLVEATRLVVDHAFDPDGLNRQALVLQAASGNAASLAIPRKLGFRHVGTHRDAELLGDGGYDDLEEFELIRP